MRLLILALFTLTSLILTASAEKRIALIIGNNNYETPGWALDNPVNDAELMAEALEQVGFEVETVTDADFDEMQEAFQRHGDRLAAAGKDAIGFFFYAGHGAQSQGLNYLVPVDATVYNEADLWREAPNLGLLMRYLDFAGNETNFIVLDACRNNPMPRATRTIEQGLAAAGRARGTLIAYSTAPGTVAEDGSGNPNSPFTTALASVITRPGYSAESLFRVVATRVEQMTNGRQLPWTESALRGEIDFCFAGCELAADTSEETTALAQILAGKDLAMLQGFLRSYPGSQHRGFVEDQIQLIQAEQSAADAIRQAREDNDRIREVLGVSSLVSELATPWKADPTQITARLGMAERTQPTDPAFTYLDESLFVFFNENETRLSAENASLLDQYAAYVARPHVQTNGPKSLLIIASCGPDESNTQTCADRGDAVRQHLVANGIYNVSFLMTENWGRIRPLTVGDSGMDAAALNRYAAIIPLHDPRP